jgi:DNA-binding NarL/FixJ family response regulator
MTRIRVLLADDHALFRRGVAAYLAAEPDFEVMGEAADGSQALEMVRELMPDLIVMDVSMPVMDGLEATRRIKAQFPYVKIVVLTVSDGERNLFEAVKAGAMGYLLKNVQPQALANALRGVMRGETSVSRTMAARLLEEFARQARERPPATGVLTPREREVLDRVARGASNKEIAADLDIAENTVKNHLKNILEKLHLENRVQAATYAMQHGLVDPPTPPN